MVYLNNTKNISNIYLYSIPATYATKSLGMIKMRDETYIDINKIDDVILHRGPGKGYHEDIEKQLIRMNIDIDGTNEDIENIYYIVIKACKDIFNMDVDVFYTQNYGYGKGDMKKTGNSHHLVIDGISCDRSTQVHFWKHIQDLYPNNNFEFDVGHLVDSRKWYRFPCQYKEAVAGTEHIIIYGELKSFVLNYTDDCVNVTDELNIVYKDKIDKDKCANDAKQQTNIMLKSTVSNIQKIREFSLLLSDKYIEDYNEWRNMVWSVRAMGKDFKFVAIEISQRYSRYSTYGFIKAWNSYNKSRGKQITSKSFFYFCKDSNEPEFKLLCKKWNMSEMNIENKQTIDEYFAMDLRDINYVTEESKYICCDKKNKIQTNNNMLSAKHLILKADMGKGKTQFIKHMLNIGRSNNLNKLPNMLFVSSRKSFANFICAEFGVHNYLDFMDDARKYKGCTQLCIQLESLHKIDETINYDYVILDECESILKQFSSPTLKQVVLSYSVFESIIKKAKKVIYADAFVSNRSLDYIREIRIIGKYPEQMFMIHNTVPAISDKKAIQIPCAKYENTVIKMLHDDKKIFAPSCSKAKLISLENRTLRECSSKKTISYHSDNDDKITDTLKDVNTHWKKYDLISCTGTITVGISFDVRDYIDNVVLDARNSMGPCPRDIIQMIRRVRHSGNLLFSLPYHAMSKCVNKHAYKLISDLDDENKEKIDIIKKSLATEMNVDATVTTSLDRLSECTSKGLKIILHGNLRESVMSQFHFKDMLLEMFSLIGYDVKTCVDLKKEDSNDKENRNYEEEFDAIDDIQHEQIDVIVSNQKKKHVRDTQPRIDKYFFNNMFDININKSLKANIFFNIYQNRYKKYIINNLQFEKSNLSHLEKTNIELEKNDYTVTTMKMTTEKTNLINNLNKIMKIKHSQDTTATISKKNVDLAKEYLKANIETVTTLYNTTVNKNSKKDSYGHLLKSIYKNWSDISICSHKKNKQKVAMSFKLRGFNYYNHIKLPTKMNHIDVFEETD